VMSSDQVATTTKSSRRWIGHPMNLTRGIRSIPVIVKSIKLDTMAPSSLTERVKEA
jgi:hypothetical protein